MAQKSETTPLTYSDFFKLATRIFAQKCVCGYGGYESLRWL